MLLNLKIKWNIFWSINMNITLEYFCKYYLPYALNIIISNTLSLLIIPWTWITFFIRANTSLKKELKVMGVGTKLFPKKLLGHENLAVLLATKSLWEKYIIAKFYQLPLSSYSISQFFQIRRSPTIITKYNRRK